MSSCKGRSGKSWRTCRFPGDWSCGWGIGLLQRGRRGVPRAANSQWVPQSRWKQTFPFEKTLARAAHPWYLARSIKPYSPAAKTSSPPGCRDGRTRQDISCGKKRGSVVGMIERPGPAPGVRRAGKGIRSEPGATSRTRGTERQRRRKRLESRRNSMSRSQPRGRGNGVRTSGCPLPQLLTWMVRFRCELLSFLK